ncbi:MAG: D-glycero-beta-D-manno-heptose 1-phosphate adenylyltransferase [Candidatus Cloacimonetes bacterium]|nr:D-glycero-beta-D-manno-heptose 1-phosphate adenylyltransferase [Candidatus Cloacimonadota bacterium]
MPKLEEKITDQKALVKLCQKQQALGKKIVFTNGCFDILHAGHVQYLEEARNLGDILVVGLNSDSSVSRLKGASRPINTEQNRALVLAALCAIDYVCIFEEDTPLTLIKAILPDILVKGGDWQPHQIVGADIVLANNGKVHSLQFTDGLSTTSVIRKIEGKREF